MKVMKSYLMICLIACSGCGTMLRLRDVEEVPTSPRYDFEIIQTDRGQMACLSSADTQKLFEELRTCRGR